MQRIVRYSLIMVLVSAVGCQKGQREAAPLKTAQADYGLEPDLYVADAGTTAPANPAPAFESDYQPYAAEPAAADPLALTATGRRMHVVTKGDTLFGLARRYYNNASRWKDIYEANRNVISDPNRLRVGWELAIP